MNHHLLDFALVALVVWPSGTFAFIYFQPRIFYTGVRRGVLRGMGVKAGGIPVNTFYALPALNSPSMSKSALILTGNRDTLYTGGALDLGQGPQILHVPEMAGRYYSVEFFSPWLPVCDRRPPHHWNSRRRLPHQRPGLARGRARGDDEDPLSKQFGLGHRTSARGRRWRRLDRL
jgi:Protein of unknown function (DUF1254)